MPELVAYAAPAEPAPAAAPPRGPWLMEIAPWLAMVSLALVLTTLWMVKDGARREMLAGLRTQADSTATHSAAYVAHVLGDADALLQHLVNALASGPGLPQEATRLAKLAAEHHGTMPALAGFALLDPGGNLSLSTGPSGLGAAALRSLAAAARPPPETKAAIGLIPGEPPRGYLGLARARGDGLGSLVALLDRDLLERHLASLLPAAGGAVLLAEMDGPPLARAAHDSPSRALDAALASARRTSWDDAAPDRPAALAVWRALPAHGLFVLALPASPPMLQAWWRAALTSLVLAGALALLTIGGMFSLRREWRVRSARAIRLAAAEGELRAALQIARLGHWRRELASDQLRWDVGMHRLFGTDPARFAPSKACIPAAAHPEDRALLLDAVAEAERGAHGPIEVEWRALRPDGSAVWIWSKLDLERDVTGHAVALRGVCQDVTRRRHAEDEARRLSQQDLLTGLPNRARLRHLLEETLEQARRNGRAAALLYLDLDGFKAVNDRHGHAAGDRLLRETGRRLTATTRAGDAVARLGADDFVVLLADLPAGEPAAAIARGAAERIAQAIAEPFALGDAQGGLVSASMGVALFPEDATDAETLLARADTALQRTRHQGRNGFAFFSAEMDRLELARRALEQDLRQALARGEFHIAWQPQARTADRRVTGFEVLLRWQHPVRGNLPPDLFIPAAEASGDILAIGAWVLESACRAAAGWPQPLSVAVNISALQVQRADLPALVRRVLAETGLAPARLELEVTESLLIQDVARAGEALAALRGMGVRVALDDFGTGYSSLKTLRSYPFDRLKIDRGFVAGLTEDAQSTAIVRGVLGLARGLGLAVTAEGVETEAQLAALAAEGCEDVQGWLLGRPAPIEAWGALTGAAGWVPRLVA